jgi:hypothetical protein
LSRTRNADLRVDQKAAARAAIPVGDLPYTRHQYDTAAIVLLLIVWYVIDVFAKSLGISHPFSPVRMRKLITPNHILTQYLKNNGYPFKCDLYSALEFWKKDAPQDWES